MDRIENYRQIIEKILTDYGAVPYSYGEIDIQFIISSNRNHYLLMAVGWEKNKRVHGCVIHIELIEDKIWIQRDGSEHGIANDFVEAGIPKEQIVLAFYQENIRHDTEFAVK